GRPPFNFHSLEAVVIIVDVLSLSRDAATIRGIVNDQVRVAAHGNRSFLWKKSKDLGRSRTRRVNKTVKVQGTALHSIRVQQVDSIFNPGNAVGNLGEGIFSQQLLIGVKRTMVR